MILTPIFDALVRETNEASYGASINPTMMWLNELLAAEPTEDIETKNP